MYLSQQLVGQLISASVSYTDGFGNDEEITLQAVSPVIDVSHHTQGTLQVLGDASQYSLLRADASAISDSDGIGRAASAPAEAKPGISASKAASLAASTD